MRMRMLRGGAVTALAFVLTACGDDPAPVEITDIRETRPTQAAAPAGLDESSRLGVGMDPHAGVPGMGGAGMGGMGGMGSGMPAGGGGFAWDLPAGWQEIPAPPATMAAFGMEAHVDTRMTVSRAGGTLEDNVQRWRRQMGLERASAAELGDLPHVEVLGAPGVLVDVEGTFQGMSGPSMAGARLLGIIVPQGRESVFLKLLGPAEAVEAEHDAFLAFATSLREAPAGSLPAGHPPMDGGGAMRPPARPRATTAPLAWDVPPGWEQVESRPPRLATFKPANTKDTQCLVTVLGGAGGGVAANLTEWRRQLGLGPLTDAEYAALERTSLLGTTAVFLKADGRTGTEDGSEGVAATLYGAILPRDEDTVFVKMWGPTEEMKPTWDAFRALVESLRE